MRYSFVINLYCLYIFFLLHNLTIGKQKVFFSDMPLHYANTTVAQMKLKSVVIINKGKFFIGSKQWTKKER